MPIRRCLRPDARPHQARLLIASLVLGAASSCGGAPSSRAPGPPASPPADTGTKAAPAPGSAGPRIERACLEAYAACPMVVGLPAISADGKLVAVPDMERAGEREELPLTVRIFDADSGRALSELPVITYRDYDQGADPMTAELSSDTRAAIEARVVAVEHELARGRYRPLTALGTVHEQRAGRDVDGLRASFDGAELRITDTRTGQTRWRRAIGPAHADAPAASDDDCAPSRVAEVTVWAGRTPDVVVAHVGYMGAGACDSLAAFLVWR